MRAIRPNNRRRSLAGKVLLGFSALVIGGVGTVAALGALKVIDLQRLAFWRQAQPIPADWVAIPRCARAIPEYMTITNEYLLNPVTSQWFMDHQPPDKARELVKKGVITDIEKIRFRVTAREHPAGPYFTENDLMPVGTHPGVVAGIPAGKLAYTLDASRIKGVHDLKEGDHLDLWASVSVDMPGTGHSGGGAGTNVVVAPDMVLLPKRSVARPLVQDGVVVTPVRVRNAPVSSTQSGSVRTTPLQEVVIAVEPQEVRCLAQALELKCEITCVARSGRPLSATKSSPNPSNGGLLPVLAALVKAVAEGDRTAGSGNARPALDSVHNRVAAASGGQGAGDITPDFDPMAHTRYMEVMIGDKRQYVVFAGPGRSPVVASQEEGSAKTESEARPSSVPDEAKQ